MIYGTGYGLIALWIAVYTISYGVWEYRKGNKTAGITVFVLTAFGAVLTVAAFF